MSAGSGDTSLRAVVRDAADAVTIEQHLGRGCVAFFAVEGARVSQAAVGEAAGGGEPLAAAAFELFVRRAAASYPKPRRDTGDQHAGRSAARDARVPGDAGAVEQGAKSVRRYVDAVGHGSQIGYGFRAHS